MDANTDGRPPRYVAPVTAEQLQAAVRILMRAWAPAVPLPGDDGYDDKDGYLGRLVDCNCGGQDDDGEDVGCNCGPSCDCENCGLNDWQMYKRCWKFSDSTRCAGTPQFRVVVFRLTRISYQGTYEGAVCSHPAGVQCSCTPGSVWVDAGVRPDEYFFQSACSLAHAQQLLARARAYDAKTYAHAAPENQPHYRIEPWTYVPHMLELPKHLAVLRANTESAVSNIGYAIKDHGRGRDAIDWLQYAREHLARAAWQAAQPVEDPDHGPGDYDEPPGASVEEPPEPDGPWDQDPVAAEASAP